MSTFNNRSVRRFLLSSRNLLQTLVLVEAAPDRVLAPRTPTIPAAVAFIALPLPITATMTLDALTLEEVLAETEFAILFQAQAIVATMQRTIEVTGRAWTFAADIRVASLETANVFDWLADSTELAVTVALVILVNARTLAGQVRVAHVVLFVLLAAQFEPVGEALQVISATRTVAVVMRVADLEVGVDDLLPAGDRHHFAVSTV